MSVKLPSRDRDEYDLLDRAADWPQYPCRSDLTAEVLRQVAAAHGYDFAVAVLYDRLRRSPEHGPFIRRVDRGTDDNAETLPGVLAIVPGAFYRERPDTGADGRRLVAVAERLGCRAECI